MDIIKNKFDIVIYQIKHNNEISDEMLETITANLCDKPFQNSLIESDRNLFHILSKTILTYAIATCSYESLPKYIHNRNLLIQSIKQLISGELKFNQRNSLAKKLNILLNEINKSFSDFNILLKKIEMFTYYFSMEFSIEEFNNIIDKLFFELEAFE